MKIYHYLIAATATLFAMTGCNRDANTAADIPQEPQDTQLEAQEPEVALPTPELQDDEGKPEVKAENTPQVPSVMQEFEPLADDKWDVPLPTVELVPGDPNEERTPEVEAKLSEMLKKIESNDSNLLAMYFVDSNRRHDDYESGFFGGAPARAKAKPHGGAHKAKPAPSRAAAFAEAEPLAAPSPKMAAKAAVIADFGSKGSGGSDLGAKLVPPTVMNTDEFSQFDPNRFMSTATNPLSTFGADVDTAAYTEFRHAIQNNWKPSNRNLRTEEMINYFKYDYPNPKANEPFSVTTEISRCPWNDDTKLLMIGTKTRDLTPEERPASNIVFLLDISGSMRSEQRLNLIKASIVSMLPKLTAQDKISIVTYSGRERFIIDGVPGDHHKTILKALTLFEANGVTNGEAGIQMAYAVAKKNYIKGGNNRIIMGTDGDLNVGISSTNELKALIEKKRASGIFLSVLGVGSGNYKDNKLETLADSGNGNYHYLDSLREGRRVLVDEFTSTVFVVAKDVKFQVDFNPSKIKGYRQIGYETRRLNAEDFADDTKDGGEIGPGHQVTILYEIVETGSSVNVPEPTSKYQKVENVNSNEYATVKLRYKQPNGDVSSELSWPITEAAVKNDMSANLSFASAVAATAMLLNDSPFKGTATYANIIKQLRIIPNIDKDEYRSEFLSLVEALNHDQFGSRPGYRVY